MITIAIPMGSQPDILTLVTRARYELVTAKVMACNLLCLIAVKMLIRHKPGYFIKRAMRQML